MYAFKLHRLHLVVPLASERKCLVGSFACDHCLLDTSIWLMPIPQLALVARGHPVAHWLQETQLQLSNSTYLFDRQLGAGLGIDFFSVLADSANLIIFCVMGTGSPLLGICHFVFGARLMC